METFRMESSHGKSEGESAKKDPNLELVAKTNAKNEVQREISHLNTRSSQLDQEISDLQQITQQLGQLVTSYSHASRWAHCFEPERPPAHYVELVEMLE